MCYREVDSSLGDAGDLGELSCSQGTWMKWKAQKEARVVDEEGGCVLCLGREHSCAASDNSCLLSDRLLQASECGIQRPLQPQKLLLFLPTAPGKGLWIDPQEPRCRDIHASQTLACSTVLLGKFLLLCS